MLMRKISKNAWRNTKWYFLAVKIHGFLMNCIGRGINNSSIWSLLTIVLQTLMLNSSGFLNFHSLEVLQTSLLVQIQIVTWFTSCLILKLKKVNLKLTEHRISNIMRIGCFDWKDSINESVERNWMNSIRLKRKENRFLLFFIRASSMNQIDILCLFQFFLLSDSLKG